MRDLDYIANELRMIADTEAGVLDRPVSPTVLRLLVIADELDKAHVLINDMADELKNVLALLHDARQTS